MATHHHRLAALATALLAGCSTVDTGVQTTPTYAAARLVPAVRAPQNVAADATRAAVPNTATISPGAEELRAGYWRVTGYDPTRRYSVPVKYGKATVFLLTVGERFNGDAGGRVEDFAAGGSYSGPRPTFYVKPLTPGARGDLKLFTTGDPGFYRFDLVPSKSGLDVVDITSLVGGAAPRATTTAGCSALETEGDHTPLKITSVGEGVPAWAPTAAWADSYKLVVRFAKPLPTLPALFAGMEGEQRVNYRTASDAAYICIVTDRRVTEAELRHGGQALRLTADPDAIRAGVAADPMKGWQGAGTMPSGTDRLAGISGGNVAVLVMPPEGLATTREAFTAPTESPLPRTEVRGVSVPTDSIQPGV